MDWIKKNRDMLLAVGGLTAFFLLLFLLTLFFKNGEEEKTVSTLVKKVEKVELGKKQKGTQTKATTAQTSSYFLKPGAADIIEKFATLDSHQLRVESKKLPGLRIAWPVYFYSMVDNDDGTTTLEMDSLENGFGVTIVCNLEPTAYPKLRKLQQGDKFWIAGEVIGVDPEGVGQIFLTPEHVNFKEDARWTLSTKTMPDTKK